MISFKDLSNLWLWRKGMSMPTRPWLLDFLAKPTVIRSPLLSHRGRSGVDGGLWGSRSHLCNRFMVKCYTNAYKGFSLSLFPAPSFISLSFSFLTRLSIFSLSFFFFFSRSRLPRCFFVVFVRVSRNASALPSIPSLSLLQIHSPQLGLTLPFAPYRSLKPNERWMMTMYRAKFLGIIDKHRWINIATWHVKIKVRRNKDIVTVIPICLV